jgi:dephospho-CoA kinase
MLSERGLPVSREALQALGREIHRSPGQWWLCERVAAEIPEGRNAVIDGLRYREDHECLAEKFGPAFLHIHIEAPIQLQRTRLLSRGDSEQAVEQALLSDAELRLLRETADEVIRNDDDVRALKASLHSALDRRGLGGVR